MLEVRDLSVQFEAPKGNIVLIEDINLSIKYGEIFALVGESGSGKTTLACALTKLFFPFSRYATSGDVSFAEHNLLQSLEDHALRQIKEKEYTICLPGTRAVIESDLANQRHNMSMQS